MAGAPAWETATAGTFGKNADKLGSSVIAFGAWMAAVPAGGYGYIQTKGLNSNPNATGAMAAGAAFDAAGGDTWTTAAVGTDHISGYATVAVATNVFTGRLL